MNFSDKFKQAVKRIDQRSDKPLTKEHHFKTYEVTKAGKAVAWNLTYDEAIRLAIKVRKKLTMINELDETGKCLYDITDVKLKEVD